MVTSWFGGGARPRGNESPQWPHNRIFVCTRSDGTVYDAAYLTMLTEIMECSCQFATWGMTDTGEEMASRGGLWTRPFDFRTVYVHIYTYRSVHNSYMCTINTYTDEYSKAYDVWLTALLPPPLDPSAFSWHTPVTRSSVVYIYNIIKAAVLCSVNLGLLPNGFLVFTFARISGGQIISSWGWGWIFNVNIGRRKYTSSENQPVYGLNTSKSKNAINSIKIEKFVCTSNVQNYIFAENFNILEWYCRETFIIDMGEVEFSPFLCHLLEVFKPVGKLIKF